MNTFFEENVFIQMVSAAILSGAVISAVLGIIFHGKAKRIETEIKKQFEESMELFRSKREWKEKSVSELLGPVYMQLDRTKRAFDRWTSKNLYLEMKVIREGNVTIRNLLLEKGHLIPPEALNEAGKFVEHYDRWLEEFEKQRLTENTDLETPFVFVAPVGYPFPEKSASKFRELFRGYWKELYAKE